MRELKIPKFKSTFLEGRLDMAPVTHPSHLPGHAPLADRSLGRLDMARFPQHPSTAFSPIQGEALNQNSLIINN